MPHALWTPVAEADLDEILFYIAFVARRPTIGERIYSEIRDKGNEHVEKQLASAAAPSGLNSRSGIVHPPRNDTDPPSSDRGP
jgi:hypothetical protein